MFGTDRYSGFLKRLIGAWLLLLGLTGLAAARDYVIGIAVTQCRTTDGDPRIFSWAAEPTKAATDTLSLLTPILAGTRGEQSPYATGQSLQLPTRASLEKSLRRLRDEAGAGDRVVLYLATVWSATGPVNPTC